MTCQRRHEFVRGASRGLATLAAVGSLALSTAACSRGAGTDTSTGTDRRATAVTRKADRRATGGAMIRLKTYHVIDAQGIGLEAFSLLIPADWQTQGGVMWPLQNPAMPAEVAFRAFSPATPDALEVFPTRACSYNPALLGMFPIGSLYMGSEMREPMHARQALKTMVIGRNRTGASDLRVTSEADVPELQAIAEQIAAQELRQGAPGVQAHVTAAKVRVEYSLGGQPVEEEFYGTVTAYAFPVGGFGQTATIWTRDHLFSFRAAKGQLDSHARLYETIVKSFTVNPQWLNKYLQVVRMLTQQQIQNIHRIGELSRYLSRTSNEISDMMMQAYENRQAAYDRISTNFSQTIRGVDEWIDPATGTHTELPSGYDNAWVNGLGEYVLSENPSYNPNIESNQNWQPLKRK
jgi:hypothetical protein